MSKTAAIPIQEETISKRSSYSEEMNVESSVYNYQREKHLLRNFLVVRR